MYILLGGPEFAIIIQERYKTLTYPSALAMFTQHIHPWFTGLQFSDLIVWVPIIN